MEDEAIPVESEIVTCTSCRTELVLDELESRNRKYSCPNCHNEYHLRPSTIAEEAVLMIRQGEIPLSIWEKIDFWYAPLILVVPGILMMILLPPLDSVVFPLLPAGMIIWGLFHSYRALVSHKLTFVPSSDPLVAKVEIIRKLQQRFKWFIIEAKDGAFVFTQRNWLDDPREIMIFCTDQGYHINCMVHSSRADTGVSIFQTRDIVKALTTDSNQKQNSAKGQSDQ